MINQNELAGLGEISEAMAKIQGALKVNPEDPLFLYKLGNLYQQRGELDEAIEQYQMALSIQPRFVEVLNNLAMVYVTKEEYDKSISLVKKMI